MIGRAQLGKDKLLKGPQMSYWVVQGEGGILGVEWFMENTDLLPSLLREVPPSGLIIFHLEPWAHKEQSWRSGWAHTYWLNRQGQSLPCPCIRLVTQRCLLDHVSSSLFLKGGLLHCLPQSVIWRIKWVNLCVYNLIKPQVSAIIVIGIKFPFKVNPHVIVILKFLNLISS